MTPTISYLRHDGRGGVRSQRGRLYPAYEGLAWLQCAVSLEISIVAWHCCHVCPDLSLSGWRTVPTTAYLYGPETAGPPVSGRTEDGESAPKTDPWESAPWSWPAPPTGPARH